MPKRAFKDLDEKEILALAISLEEEDARVYGDFAEGLRESSPATSKMFEEMQTEESRHRAVVIVVCELGIISYIRHRYMDTPLVSSTLQVVVGGGLVFAVGILIGTS